MIRLWAPVMHWNVFNSTKSPRSTITYLLHRVWYSSWVLFIGTTVLNSFILLNGSSMGCILRFECLSWLVCVFSKCHFPHWYKRVHGGNRMIRVLRTRSITRCKKECFPHLGICCCRIQWGFSSLDLQQIYLENLIKSRWLPASTPKEL